MENSILKITIIGSGGVATNIGRLLLGKGITIGQILGRSNVSAKALAEKLGCPYILTADQLNQNSDLYIVCVQDREILPLLPQLKIPADAMIVHTAGGVAIDVFKGFFDRYGVFYPLQSLRKETSVVPEIPFYLDGNSHDAKSVLASIATRMGLDYRWADDAQRMQLHVAAVFCSNFPNFFYSLAEKFCLENDLDFSSLLPLIEETGNRLAREGLSPAALQTGPAVRGDITTTEKHLHLLEKDQEAQALYRLLSEKIRESTLFKN